jgi:glutaminyl-peptide cyclotransferase
MTGGITRKSLFAMESQGRSRLIVGGLTLAAVILVISLLFTRQNGRLPQTESPLTNDATPTSELTAVVAEVNVISATATPAAQSESPLAAPESPLASPASIDGIPVPTTSSITTTAAVTAAETLSATDSLTSPITVTARSTVTVTLVEPYETPKATLYGYEVITTYPHDPQSYIEGLQYVDGDLYEGSGLYGHSSLRHVDLETGTVEKQVPLAEQYFGEGIYVLDDRIYQLTWQSHIGFIYDRASFEQVDQFTYPTEGWGLTYDGQDLIMSDGSSTLFWRDPATFEEVKRVAVADGNQPVKLLNELEYIKGSVWANVWLSDDIVIIDPTSGQVTGRVDLTGILPPEQAANAEVLNGIAYDEENDRIFVTGKFWPLLFEIRLVPE